MQAAKMPGLTEIF